MAFVSDRWVEGLEGEGNRNYDIGIVDLDGTVQRLTDSPFDESMPTVSGDGNWIGYHVDHGENPFENTRNYEVWVAEAKGGGKAYNLTDNSGRDSFPCFYSAFQAPVTIQSKPQSIESPRTVPDAPMPVPIPPAPSSGPSF
jgi:Tol biopolymer transport system component